MAIQDTVTNFLNKAKGKIEQAAPVVENAFKQSFIEPPKQIYNTLDRVNTTLGNNEQEFFNPFSSQFRAKQPQFAQSFNAFPTASQPLEGIRRATPGASLIFKQPLAPEPVNTTQRSLRIGGAALPSLLNGATRGVGLLKTGGEIAATGLIGGGINKVFGGNFGEGVSSGVEALPMIQNISGLTNPLISRFAGKAEGLVDNPLAKGLLSRAVSGAGNIPQGIAISAGLRQPYTPTNAALDFGAGAVVGAPVPETHATSNVNNLFNNEAFKASEKDIPNLKNVVQNLKGNEMQVMENFLDLMRNRKADGVSAKVGTPAANDIEYAAHFLAEELGISPRDVPNRTLSKVFDDVLTYNRQLDRGRSVVDAVGPNKLGFVGENKATTDVPGLNVTRDAEGNVIARSFEPQNVVPRTEKQFRIKKVPVTEVTDQIKKATTQGIDVPVAKPYEGNIIGGTRDRVAKSIEGFFGSQGEAGQQFANSYRQARQEAGFNAGQATVDLEKVLKKLTPDEINQFADVAEGKAEASTPNLQAAIGAWDLVRKDIADKAEGAGLQIKLKDQQRLAPFTPRENYYPHFLPEEFLKNKAAQKEAFQQMVKTGWASSISDAESKFNQFVRSKVKRRYGNLENARESDFPIYEKDPRKVLLSYVDSAYHRVADAKYFGSGDEKAYKLADQIALNGGDGDLARRMMDRVFGKEDVSNFTKQVTGKLRGAQTITKLGLGAITNIGQSVSTALKTNPVVTVQAIGDALGSNKAEARDFAMKTGELLDTSKKEMLQAAGGEQNFAGKFLDKVGFSKSEQFNRIVATNAGKRHVEYLANELLNNPSKGVPRRALEALGLDPNRIISQGGLSEQDTLKAAKAVTDATQFSTEPFDLPYAWSSPWGKVLTQFKSFGYKQTQFLGDQTKQVVSEAKQGNLRPLANALAVVGVAAPVVGEILKDAKSIITNKDRSSEGKTERYFNDLSTAMSFGLFDDAGTLVAGKYGPSGTLGAVAGPTASDAYNFTTAAQSLLQDRKTLHGKDEVVARAKPMARFLTQKIPVVGSTLSNTFIPNSSIDTNFGINAKANKTESPDSVNKGLQLFGFGKPTQADAAGGLPVDKPTLIALYKKDMAQISSDNTKRAEIQTGDYATEEDRQAALDKLATATDAAVKRRDAILAQSPDIENLGTAQPKAPKAVKETKTKTPKTKKITLKTSSVKVPEKLKLKTPSLISKPFKVDLSKLKTDASTLKLGKALKLKKK